MKISARLAKKKTEKKSTRFMGILRAIRKNNCIFAGNMVIAR
jgi:hypothetical protein